MQFIHIQTIPQMARKDVTLVVGNDQGKPICVAKKKEQHWILYRRPDLSSLDAKSFQKIGSFYALEDVLVYFQGKGLQPYCPAHPSETDSISETDSDVQLERRRHSRKKIDIPGNYKNKRTGSTGEVQVQDVSFKDLASESLVAQGINGEYRNPRTGSKGSFLVEDMSFKGMKFKSIKPHDIQVGDDLIVSFSLDQSKSGQLKRVAQARIINKAQVGVEFLNPPYKDKGLSLYLI